MVDATGRPFYSNILATAGITTIGDIRDGSGWADAARLPCCRRTAATRVLGRIRTAIPDGWLLLSGSELSPLTLSVAICPGYVYRWCPSPCIQVSWQQWPSSLLVSVGGDLRSATLSSVLLYSRCGLLACPPPTPKTSLSSTSTEYYLRLLDSIDFVWLHPRDAEFVVILWPPWITCSSGVQRLVGFDCLCDGSCQHYTNRCCHLTLRYGRHRSYPACLAAARHLLSFGVLLLFTGDSICPTPFPQS